MKGAFMRELVAYVICAIVVLYGIRESIGTAFEERTLKYSLYKVLYYFSILLTFFLVIVNLNFLPSCIMLFAYSSAFLICSFVIIPTIST